MKKKIVLWGNDEKDKKILIGLELKAKENQVNIYSFDEDIVTEAFYNQMMDDWRAGRELEFPEGYQTIVRELSVTEDILPETIKVQRADLINRAKAEWHFVVLSTKLYDLYNTELEDLKDRIEKLIDFDSGVWEEIKGFWGKVVEQSQERNLFREHAEKLKGETNNLFTKMKEFKTKANAELSKVSKEHVATFTTRLNEVKTKATDGKSLSPLFEELKKIQKEFNGTEFTRNDRSKIWKRIDEAFKLVKEKKYGKPQDGGGGAVSRVERRYQGLKSAIGKMQASINRDKKDIEFQNKRVNDTNGQLEMQIRQAKVTMIQERINSKQEKLDEMLATQVELEKRVEKEKEKAEKRAEKKEIEKKKVEVKEKLQAEIKEKQPEISEEDAAKLEAAAADINAPRKSKKKNAKPAPAETKKDDAKAGNKTEAKEEEKEPETLLGAAAAAIEDAVENVVDTVKAVGSVISDKVEDKVEDLKESAVDAKDKAAPAKLGAEVAEDAGSKNGETMMKGGLLGAAVAAGAKMIKDASEKIEDLTEDAKAKIEDTKEAIAEKNSSDDKVEAKDEKSENKEEASDTDKTEVKVSETLMKGGLLATAVAAGSKLVKDASEGLGDLAEKVGLDETIEKAKATLEETKDAISNKVSEVKESVTSEQTESVDEVADRVRKEAKGESSSEEE